MPEVLRVVPDVNVIVRAIAGRGLAQQLYHHFRRGELRWVISAELLAELYRVLEYPRILTLGSGITPSIAFGLAVELLTLCEYHPQVARLTWPSLSDPKDWYLLDLLYGAEADVLLTADRRVLAAGHALGLPIMTLEAFYAGGNLPPLEEAQPSSGQAPPEDVFMD